MLDSEYSHGLTAALRPVELLALERLSDGTASSVCVCVQGFSARWPEGLHGSDPAEVRRRGDLEDRPVLKAVSLDSFRKSGSVLQVLLVGDELPSRGQLPQRSLCEGQREAFPFACKSLNLCPGAAQPVLIQALVPQGYVPPAKNGLEQKRPGRPLNITSLVRLSSAVPNQISVTWSPEIGKVSRDARPVAPPPDAVGSVAADPLPLAVSDLFPVGLPGEAAHVAAAAAEAEDEGHPKPGPLQSAE